jgi:lysophospholipase L1-like esterase
MKNLVWKSLMVAFCATAASGLSPAPERLAEGERIVFLGDSITELGVFPGGYVRLTGEALNATYPDLHLTVIGAGVSGHKVPDCQQRLQRDVLDKKPTIVVIYIGINDVWHSGSGNGTPKDAFKAGLESMIGEIKGVGARVILCTPTVIGELTGGTNTFDKMLDEYSDVSRGVARETGSQLLDLRKKCIEYLAEHNKENKERGILTYDSVHLSLLGNRFLASLMLEALGAPPKVASSVWYDSPKFDPGAATAFTTKTECRFLEAKDGEIHYTLDGAEPTKASPKYARPVPVDKTALVKAKFYHKDGNESLVVRQQFTRVEPVVLNGKALESGLDYKYFEGEWASVPDFAALAPATSGTVSRVTLAVRKRDDNFCLEFSGYVRIQEKGQYTFFTASDDGSVLFIDGQKIVDNDGYHGESEKSGTLQLEPGLHPILVGFFEAGGGEVLTVRYEGPGVTKMEIPDTALFRTGSGR